MGAEFLTISIIEMEITRALLCESANKRGATWDVTRAFEGLSSPDLPFAMRPFNVLVWHTWNALDQGDVQEVRIVVYDEDRKSVGEYKCQLDPKSESVPGAGYAVTPFPIAGVVLYKYGPHSFEVTIGDSAPFCIPLRVGSQH